MTQQKERIKRSKVVVRRLPPGMTSEQFLEQIQPVTPYNWYQYVRPDYSLGPTGQFCRAYLNFVQPDDVFTFCEQWDGYVFVDSKGTESVALVELAPYQMIDKAKHVKPDSKKNTVHTSPEYETFLEDLEQLKNSQPPSWEANLEEIKRREKEHNSLKQKTPLIEHLAKKREEKKNFIENRRRMEEERRKAEIKERKAKARANALAKEAKLAAAAEAKEKRQMSKESKDKLEKLLKPDAKKSSTSAKGKDVSSAVVKNEVSSTVKKVVGKDMVENKLDASVVDKNVDKKSTDLAAVDKKSDKPVDKTKMVDQDAAKDCQKVSDSNKSSKPKSAVGKNGGKDNKDVSVRKLATSQKGRGGSYKNKESGYHGAAAAGYQDPYYYEDDYYYYGGYHQSSYYTEHQPSSYRGQGGTGGRRGGGRVKSYSAQRANRDK